jgi:uncharacterized protein YeaO (DUF488 family)
MVTIKRIYEQPKKTDGFRVLVDRLWPRGISKERARINLWLKDISPSSSLRKWFHHDPTRWEEFQKRYSKELTSHKEELTMILEKAKRNHVTLLYSAKDIMHNNATALLIRLSQQYRTAVPINP